MSAVAQGSSNAPSPASDALPPRFGRYTPFERVGRGGMAELFLARAETELGATRLVVIKLILPAFADDPRFAELLIHEAKLAARLSHRHIAQVLDLGAQDGRLYIAMEYVEGFDLNALLRLCSERGEGLPAQYALGIVVDVLEGLDYAHRRTDDVGEALTIPEASDGGARAPRPLGIVHRDVSPSNILISYDGEVKLCDFGIAHANDLVREEAGEALKGKAGYMSPEHARAEEVDARSDVFAAGIILWELLAGRRLYRPRDEVSLLEQARRATIPELPDKGLPHHDELERVVRRALARDRDERYPTAVAFQRDLEAYVAKAGFLSSRLKLGEWIATTFGTEIVEQRRASERRLPKSAPPPPRSVGPIRARASAPASVPPAPRVPSDLAIAVMEEESVPLLPRGPVPGILESRAGSATDVEPTSSAKATSSERAGSGSAASDAELIAWAKRRGVASFFFFFFMAVAIAAGWYFTR